MFQPGGMLRTFLRVAHTRNHFFPSPVLLARCNFTNCKFSLLAAAICMILRRQWQIHRTDWAGTLFYWMFLLPSAFAMQGGHEKWYTRARALVLHTSHIQAKVFVSPPARARSRLSFFFSTHGKLPAHTQHNKQHTWCVWLFSSWVIRQESGAYRTLFNLRESETWAQIFYSTAH